jgi:FG-GAP-like repeat
MSRCLFLILLSIIAASYHVSAGHVIEAVEADLDGDGRRERVVMNGEGDGALAIRRGKALLWQGVPKSWKPWKLAVADVDGDGRREVVLGVYKATHYFPKPHNCLFIYGWDGREVFPKWLGSSLSKPFTDFAFADTDLDGRDNLIAVETTREGKQCVAVYSWNGFGFTLDRQHGDWARARLFKASSGEVFVEADGRRIPLPKTEKVSGS